MAVLNLNKTPIIYKIIKSVEPLQGLLIRPFIWAARSVKLHL